MIETIQTKNNTYPKFQSEGFAAQFAIPFALHVCKGIGLDIGCNRDEWKYPGAIPVDPLLTVGFDAMNLPKPSQIWANVLTQAEADIIQNKLKSIENGFDYIFSSHCLEHLDKWVLVLEHWIAAIKPGGTLFLYLPDYSQEYWRPWNNTKHVNMFTPEIIRDFLMDTGKLKNIFVSGIDMNNSFIAMAEVK